MSYEEHTPGVFGIAAPIFNSSGQISMVIACIGFASGISEDFVNICGEKLIEAASNIMRVTGGRKPF